MDKAQPETHVSVGVFLRAILGGGGAYVAWRLALVVLMILAASALLPLGPVALQEIVDHFARHAAAGPTLFAAVFLYVFSQAVSRLFDALRVLIYAQSERRILTTLNHRVFAHVLRLPFHLHSTRRGGAISQIRENGAHGTETVLQHVVFIVLPVLTQIAVTSVILVRLDQPVFLLVLCIAVIGYAMCSAYFLSRMVPAATAASAAQVQSSAVMNDCIANYETIKFFSAETFVARQVFPNLVNTERRWLDFYRNHTLDGIITAILFSTCIGATIVLGVRRLDIGALTIGQFVLVNTYMLQMIQPMELLGYATREVIRGWGMARGMFQLLEEKTENDATSSPRVQEMRDLSLAAHNSRGGAEKTTIPATLAFCAVSSSYGAEREGLRNVTFTVPAAKTLGVVGPSGSGKTTLVRLLMRLVEPYEGSILLDGVPTCDLPLDVVRRAIAVVPQETMLFNDSIRYNIAFANPEASEEEIRRAARVAHLDEFIDSLAEGYETRVGERGVKLSGGERQRVSIARAALKRPRVYVFDEATSSMDSTTEKQIMENLREISRLHTTVIIAHRLSTVVLADEIIVLDKGSICERGTHVQLLHKNGRYSQLWSAQHAADRIAP